MKENENKGIFFRPSAHGMTSTEIDQLIEQEVQALNRSMLKSKGLLPPWMDRPKSRRRQKIERSYSTIGNILAQRRKLKKAFRRAAKLLNAKGNLPGSLSYLSDYTSREDPILKYQDNMFRSAQVVSRIFYPKDHGDVFAFTIET